MVDPSPRQTWTFVGALAMLVVVSAGAFGAHGLKSHLDAEAMGWWETGTRYLAWHALGLFVVDRVRSRVGGLCLLAGMVLFSGSLYLMALTGQRWLGAVTPLGGTAWFVGWVVIARAAWRGRSGEQGALDEPEAADDHHAGG